jgi:RNA polymerase sigma-70 factor (ECF subfamily)
MGLPEHTERIAPPALGSGVRPRVIAAEELFRAHAAYVADFVARLGVPHRDVDDCVQEVFLVVHRRGGFVQTEARPTTYLAAIAVRVVSTHRRTQARRRLADAPAAIDEAPGTGPTPEERAVTSRALARVEAALDALDLEKRAVFVLFEILEEPCDAIAQALGVPVGTVYSRLHAARAQFQRAYAALGGDEGEP